MGTKSLLVALALSSALMGCGDSESEDAGATDGSVERTSSGTVSGAEVAARAESMIRPQSGLYRAELKVLDIDLPDVPSQMIPTIRNAMERGGDTQYCLTPQDVANGYQEMVRRSQQGDCEYERFDVNGGKFDAVMTCTGEGSEAVRLTLSGTGSETSSDMDMTMQMNVPGMGEGKIRMRNHSERIGPCR